MTDPTPEDDWKAPPASVPAKPASPAAPAAPERNLLRALKPGTIDIHKALQRLLLKSGGRYVVAPHQHDWDFVPCAISWPFRKELNVPAVVLVPWDTGTGQSLADFCAYYKFEIPRQAPHTLIITSTPPNPDDLAAAEKILKSPIAVVQVVDGDPNHLKWHGRTAMPRAIAVLDDPALRQDLREVDPGDIAEAFHNAQPKDPSRQIEADLVMPRETSSFMSYSLVLINVAVYIFALVKTLKLTGQFDQYATPVLNEFSINAQVTQGEWWRFLTAGFMHIGIIHILFNMWFLFQSGPVIETALGRKRFLAIYFAGLFGCSLFSLAWHVQMDHQIVNAAGASGALCGIFYGLTGYVLAVRKILGRGRVRFFLNQTVRFTFMLILIGLLGGVDNAGHFGGAVAGFGLGYAFGMRENLQPRWLVKLRWVLVGLLFGLFILLVAGVWKQAELIAGSANISSPFDEIDTATLNHIVSQTKEIPTLENRLDAAIAAQRSSPELLADCDRLQAIWDDYVEVVSPRLSGDALKGFVHLRTQVDSKIEMYRTQLFIVGVQRLTARLDQLRLACNLGSKDRFPSTPPDAGIAAQAGDFVTKARAFLAWNATIDQRQKAADLDAELIRVESAVAQLAGWPPLPANPVKPATPDIPAPPAAPAAPASATP